MTTTLKELVDDLLKIEGGDMARAITTADERGWGMLARELRRRQIQRSEQ